MFLLMAVGFLCYKIGLISKRGNRQLSNLILHVVTPALIITTYQSEYSKEKAWNLLGAFVFAVVSIGIGILLSHLLRWRIKEKDSLVIGRMAVAYSNCGFMALPLIESVLGADGLFYGSTFVIAFNLLLWTHGVFLCDKTDSRTLSSVLRSLLTPSLISILIGLPLFFWQLQLPGPLYAAGSYLASLNTPLAMLAAGAFIAQSNWKDTVRHASGYWIAGLRLLLVPLLMILLFRWIPVNTTVKTANLIASACPTATTCVFFASRFGRDERLASQAVTLTNLLCIITIPAMAALTALLW